MKRNLFFITYLLIGTIGHSQNVINSTPSPLFTTNFQRLLFVTRDSTYRFTRFIEPNGKFYFNEEFVDSTYSCGDTRFSLDKNTMSTRAELRFKYIRSIDTINNYFPIKKKEYDEHSVINIIDEVEGSYILKQLGEPVIINLNQNIIRVLYPCEDLNSCNYYHMVKIRFFADSAKLYITSGRSVDYKGIQIIHKDSCLLKEKDIEHINKQLTKVSVNTDTECRSPGNPWILEYNNSFEYKRFIMSDYCLRGKKRLKPIVTLCYSILGYNKKYFGVSCLAP